MALAPTAGRGAFMTRMTTVRTRRAASMVPVTLPAQPAPRLGSFELLSGDARELLRDVPDQSVDLICTDPPYNLAPYSRGNIAMSWRSDFNNDVAAWDRVTFDPGDWLTEMRRVLAPHGNLFAFTSYNMLGRWHDVFDPAFDTLQCR